jgi:hypothetical protein
MKEVTIERREQKVHVFLIPDHIDEGSEAWFDIIDEFDWSDVEVKHVDETVLNIVGDGNEKV